MGLMMYRTSFQGESVMCMSPTCLHRSAGQERTFQVRYTGLDFNRSKDGGVEATPKSRAMKAFSRQDASARFQSMFPLASVVSVEG
jgi:hypothetical protein